MPGTADGVRKSWLKRRRAKKKVKKGRVAKRDGSAATTHKVAVGDTLLTIAKKYRVTLSALLKENGITSADQFSAGMVLKIPAVKTKAEKDKEKLDKALAKAKKDAEKKK